MQSYFEKNKHRETQSKLKSFRFCPYRYYLEWVEGVYEEVESTESMILGTILDDAVSLPEKEFWDKWTVVCQKRSIKEFLSKRDISIWMSKIRCGERRKDKEAEMMAKTYEDLEPSIAELKRQPLYAYEESYKAQEEVNVEYKGLQIGGTMDRCSDKLKEIRDLKRTKEIYSRNGFDSFEADIPLYGYDFQGAFYRLLKFIEKEEWYKFFIDAVDKTGNTVYNCYELSKMVLDNQTYEIKIALDALVIAKKNKEFPEQEDRKKCHGCPMFKYCNKTAIQKFVKIF